MPGAKTVWSGTYIQAIVEGRWEYVKRTRGISAAVILALTDDDEVVLVEQPRVPLGRRCLELPAGLVGDESEGEDAAVSAERELEEETGFAADHWEELGEFASSPGMVGETFRLFRATGLRRIGAGGGVSHEEIVTHVVKLAEVPAFVAARRADGCAIDVKLLAVLPYVQRPRS
ncbi:MAG: NUDIX hydrolase [Sphingomonadaceae bacterium]|nr:NUDIX hydrolase [Sphingomonadaceae bacterium]